MAKHLPTSVWASRKPCTYPNAYVRTRDRESLYIAIIAEVNTFDASFNISRRDARLLAKRINECLDATKGAK